MESVVEETLGLQVRIERVRRRLKQSDLAEAAGVGQADVSQLELDKKVVPGRRRRILAVLGMEDATDVL